MDIKHSISEKPFHILAKPGDISDKIIVVGDPCRTERLSSLLDDVKLVNKNRYFLTYTGYYKGVRITIGTHGIGAPSAAIVFEELKMLGAKTIVRLGTAGGLSRDLDVGLVFVPVAACYERGGTIGMYIGDVCYPAVPDYELSRLLSDSLRKNNIKYKMGIVASSDSFHAEKKYAKKWRLMGIKAVEMECAVLFIISRIKGFKSASVLLIIDNLETGEVLDKVEQEMYEMEIAKAILEAVKIS